MQRLCEQYNQVDKSNGMKIFHPRDQIDGMMLAFNWFENLDEPKKLNMDCLREYLGMSSEGAHDALQDVKDTAEIILRFMRLQRKTAAKVKFKDSFK